MGYIAEKYGLNGAGGAVDVEADLRQRLVKLGLEKAEPAKKKEQNFIVRNAPTIGGIVGGAAGSLLGPAGTIAGGVIGSGLGEYARQKAGGEETDLMGITKESAFGLAGGVGGRIVGAAARPLLRFAGGKAAQIGAEVGPRTFARAFTVPAKLASRLKPVETAKALTRYGVSGSLDGMRATGEAVTGANGILNKIVRSAAGSLGDEISVDNITNASRNVLSKSALISAKESKDILNTINKTIVPGKNLFKLHPVDALDQVRELEKIGYQYVNSSTKMTPNLRNEQIGEAYLAAADTVKESIEAAFKKTNVLAQFKTPEVITAIRNISPKLADDFMKAKTLSEVRGLQAPFVRMMQMIGLTEDAAQSVGGRLGADVGSRAIGGTIGAMAGGPVGAAAGFLASPFVEGAEQAIKAPLATGAGKMLSRGLPSLPGAVSAAGRVAGQTIEQSVPRLMTGGADTAGASGLPIEDVAAQMTPAGGQIDPESDMVRQMAEQYVRTKGIKSLSELKTYNDLISTKAAKPMTAEQAKAKAFGRRIEQANSIFDKLSETVNSELTGQLSLTRKIPVRFRSTALKQQDQAERNFINAVLRRESGATIKPDEFQSAALQYFPQPGDTPEVLAQKRQNRLTVQQALLEESMASLPANVSEVQFSQ